ncbi:MAG: MOSC domain-containing protein [Rubrobacter sp.]|nr:MOSC domain-containing protein [Rubrobacter sp.]
MKGVVEEIYLAPRGSVDMVQVEEARAIEHCGLEGDRYCKGTGYWTPFGDVCEVTLIDAADLDYIERELGLGVKNGEHRRNIITSGIDLDALSGMSGGRFQVGEVVLQYDRPRPPCKHIQDVTEPGMTRALVGRGGHCARVVRGGRIRPGDAVKAEQPARRGEAV